MTNLQLYRTGGLLLLVGAVTSIVYTVTRSIMTASLDPVAVLRHPFWVPINALGVVGAALVLLGLPAMYFRLAASAELSSVIGILLISVAWMFLDVFVSLYAALVAPWLADEAPGLAAASAAPPTGVAVAFIIALLAELVGTSLLGIAFMRGRRSPRWVGYALPAAAVLTIVGDLIAPTGPASDLAVNLFSNAGPLLLMATFVCLGSQALRTGDARPG